MMWVEVKSMGMGYNLYTNGKLNQDCADRAATQRSPTLPATRGDHRQECLRRQPEGEEGTFVHAQTRLGVVQGSVLGLFRERSRVCGLSSYGTQQNQKELEKIHGCSTR